MLIDWFTVAAQIINFLILMWLLKRFLYKPILNAIDAREKRIADQLALANRIQAEAIEQKNEFEQKNKQFEQQHVVLLEQARTDAQTEKKKLIQQARQETSQLRNQWLDSLEKDQKSLNISIAKRIQNEVFAISRKTLSELADSELESQIIEKFIHKLQALEDKKKIQLKSQRQSDLAIVRTAFALTQDQQKQLTQHFARLLGITNTVRFELEPDLLSGIELTSNGHKVSWNITDYLASLQQNITSLVIPDHGQNNV